MRPASIVQFERLYLAALALNFIGELLNWGAVSAALRSSPELAELGPIVPILGLAIVYSAMIALWYFAARRRSVVAKWLLAIWFVVSTCLMALGLFRGIDLGVVALLGWAAYLLRAWAVSYLFKPDADEWFATPR
jgi:hypothetical protein